MSVGIQKNHIIIALVLTIGGTIAWYALSPLLRTTVVDDALPVSAPEMPQAPESSPKATGEPDSNQSAAPVLSTAFPVVDTPSHPASGTVRIVQGADETIVRYENYKTINGPDLKIYLAKDLEAKEYIDLGPLKGTEGNINYSVPKNVDVSEYRYVLTWCEDFSVLFNSAEISVSK
ncbi:MAG: DM13 domain-containing protein [Candidatus Moranbacteria bacterium]|nr:DM13 domain-containing protein [Candidatus Moranbacteria bacterium]